MQDKNYRKLVRVSALPAPDAALSGVFVVLSTDGHPYYCDGSTWTDLLAGSGPGSTPAGADGQVQFNNAGSMAGATNVEIDNGDIQLSATDTPVTPLQAAVKLFGKKLASRVVPAMVGPSGMDAAIQPSFWRQKIGVWTPSGSGTAVPGVLGFVAPAALGTATARGTATTNLFTRTRRLGYVSATTAASFAGHYVSGAQFTTGNGAGLGGFFYSCRFGFSDAAEVPGVRAFVGLSSATAAPSNVEPNTLTQCMGIAQLSTDTTQLYLVYGGSAAQTAIPLGTNYPPMTAAGANNGIAYDLTLFAPPSGNGTCYYRVERIGVSAIEGTFPLTTPGTQLPSSATMLAHRAWRCNNAQTRAVGIDILNVYVETDY